jgi:hypothetical protein
MFQGSEQYIVRDYRLESVATEKEAFFAEVTITTEVPKRYIYLSSNKLLPVYFPNRLFDHSTMEFFGICLVNTFWLLLYFESTFVFVVFWYLHMWMQFCL